MQELNLEIFYVKIFIKKLLFGLLMIRADSNKMSNNGLYQGNRIKARFTQVNDSLLLATHGAHLYTNFVDFQLNFAKHQLLTHFIYVD